MSSPRLLLTGPAKAPTTIAFAHGAGAPMDSEFMATFADALATRSIRVARFEFPYMAARRMEGRKRPPDRAPVLMETWRAVIAELGPARTIVAGKSMGARIGSLVAAELESTGTPVRGCIYLGYPFHAPGKPMGSRDIPLGSMRTPTLLLQGERDPFGPRAEMEAYTFGPGVRVHLLPDGDHDLKPRKASGRTRAQNWQEAMSAIVAFVRAL
jgi:uncharacterized protein